MIERLLFHRVDLQRGEGGVAQAVEFSALVDADEAEAALPIADVAMPRTEIAMHLVARFGFPPPRFVQGFSFLEDLQFLHRPSFANFPLTKKWARVSTLCAATIIRRFVAPGVKSAPGSDHSSRPLPRGLLSASLPIHFPGPNSCAEKVLLIVIPSPAGGGINSARNLSSTKIQEKETALSTGASPERSRGER